SGRADFIARGGRVSAVLSGARQVPAEALDRLPGTVTYLTGLRSEWRHDIPTFGRICYRGVDPGIDLAYYGNQGALEYDFLVAPHADPGKIRIAFEGARRLLLDPGGDLVIDTASGTMRHRSPVAYQEIDGVRRPVAARYQLRGGTIHLQ